MLNYYRSGTHLGVPVHVFGTETHMTAIVGMALGKSPIPEHPPNNPGHTATFLLAGTSANAAVSFLYFINTTYQIFGFMCE